MKRRKGGKETGREGKREKEKRIQKEENNKLERR